MQRWMVLRQHAEMVRQVQALLAILLRQIKLAGKDPLAEEELQQQQAEVVATIAAPEQNQGEGSSGYNGSLFAWLRLDSLAQLVTMKRALDVRCSHNGVQHVEVPGMMLVQMCTISGLSKDLHLHLQAQAQTPQSNLRCRQCTLSRHSHASRGS